jgi:predicted outer membrane repeat protein
MPLSLRFLSLCVASVSLAPVLGAQVTRVPGFFPTIGDAVANVPSGWTILVDRGTYFERDIDFQGKTLVIRALEGPSVTVIDAQSQGRIFALQSNEGPNSRIEGFTLRNGIAQSASGGAIYLYRTSAKIRDCVFEGNLTPSGSGGAIRVEGGNPVIAGCVFTGNIASSGSGGAIKVSGATSNNVSIYSCRFFGNSAPSGSGGAIYVEDGAAVSIRSCVFARNTTPSGSGGALKGYSFFGVRPVLAVESCTFSQNDDTAIYMEGADAVIANCIVWQNPGTAIGTGGFSAGTVTASYCDIEGGYAGTGNLNVDPLFVAPASDDYRLQSSSPLIEAADPLSNVSGTDAYGDPRRVDANQDGVARGDIGADESALVALTASGSPVAGQTLVLQFSSSVPIAAGLLILGVAEAEITVPGLGSLLVDPLAPHVLLDTTVPGQVSIPIPPSTRAGTIVHAQLIGGTTSFALLPSNPLRILSR